MFFRSLKKKIKISSKESLQPKNDVSVREWSQGMNKLLASPYGTALFRAFLRHELAEENLDFVLKVQQYREASSKKQKKMAWNLYSTYVAAGAPHELNLDTISRKVIDMAMNNPQGTTFDTAAKRVYNMIENDAYQRFLQWNNYQQLINPDIPLGFDSS